MPGSFRLDRRAFLRGLGGVTLALPVLDAMGKEVTDEIPRRFCAIYTANGMSLPKTEHGIDEWSWFPAKGANGEFEFGKSTEPLSPFRVASSATSFSRALKAFFEHGAKAECHNHQCATNGHCPQHCTCFSGLFCVYT